MAFLPAHSQYLRSSGAYARLHIYRTGRAYDRRQLTFVLSRDLMNRLGWQRGEHIAMSIGTGDDVGAFMLTRTGRSGHTIYHYSGTQSARVAMTLPPEIHGIKPAAFLDRLQGAQTLDFDIADGALIVRLNAEAMAAAFPKADITAFRAAPPAKRARKTA